MSAAAGRSLHRQLLLWLLLPQLVLWMVAAFGAYRLASRQAGGLADAGLLLDTVLLLAGLVALMSMGVWAGIRKGLKPLAELQQQMEGRRADALDPVQLQAAPPEVRALAGAVNELLGQVQQNLATQRRFISDAAHQLRSPLAGLKSQAELAMQAATDPALRERLARVHQSAVRSARVVSQLLVLARAEPEAVAAQGWAVVDCGRLVQQAAAEWVPRALAAGTDLGVDLVDTGLGVHGVELLLREALVNLIDNAVCYAGAGATITVRLRRAGDDVWLDVEDNGPGLAADLGERAFERFVRGVAHGEGCGLGLAIAREIAERHGGSAQLLRAAPHGCIARLTLPAA